MLAKSEILVDDSVEGFIVVTTTFSCTRLDIKLSSGLTFTMYENANTCDRNAKIDVEILDSISQKKFYCGNASDVYILKGMGFKNIVCTSDIYGSDINDVSDYAVFVNEHQSEILYSLLLKDELSIKGSIDAYIVKRLNLVKAVEDCSDLLCVYYKEDDCVVNKSYDNNFNKLIDIKIDFFVLRALCDYDGLNEVRDAMNSSEFYGDNPEIEHIKNLLNVCDFGVRDNTDLSFFYLYRICDVISRDFSVLWDALRYSARNYMYEIFNAIKFEGVIVEVHDNYIRLAVNSDGGMPRLINKLRDADIYRSGVK